MVRTMGRERAMVLLRQLLGDVLRQLRLRQGRTLREVSAAARVSLGYLSEVERGQKEASSELLAAICKALGVPLSHVLREVSDLLALAELQADPVMAGHATGHVAGHGAGMGAPPQRETVPASPVPDSPEAIAGDAFRGDMVAA
jgi:transcriptional regulator with XRE-family HTH domain